VSGAESGGWVGAGGGGVPGGGGGDPGGGGGEPATETVTVDVALTTFPEASVAVKRTVVVPAGNAAGASVVMFGLGSTMSLAEAPARKA